MINKLVLSIFFVIILGNLTFSQSITNIIVNQEDDTLYVEYDLNSSNDEVAFSISMMLSSDNGVSFNIAPRTARGDFGRGITPGSKKKIIWEPLKDNIELDGKDYYVRIIGEEDKAPTDIEFVFIKGGSFDFGDVFKEGEPDELPVTNVTLSDFEISKCEISNKQFLKFLNEYGSPIIKDGPFKNEKMIYDSPNGISFDGFQFSCPVKFENIPVSNVTWFGAYQFCVYNNFLLPTEAQWEYAAREKGRKVRFGNGKDIASPTEINFDPATVAGFSYINSGQAKNKSVRIGLFTPNQLGLHDMSGNIAEWCFDWYDESFYKEIEGDGDLKTDPAGPFFGSYRVIRGGSWYNNGKDIRNTNRNASPPGAYSNEIGFRVVRIKQ